MDTQEYTRDILALHEKKPDPQTWTLKEEERIYRFHYTFVDIGDESQLLYCINRYKPRYTNFTLVHPQWFVLLLLHYPTEKNFQIFQQAYPGGDKRRGRVIKRLLKHPELSKRTLAFLKGKFAGGKRGSGARRKYQKILAVEAKFWAYEI